MLMKDGVLLTISELLKNNSKHAFKNRRDENPAVFLFINYIMDECFITI